MITLRVEKLIARGDGLARHEGKVIFIPDTAPGDLVAVEIQQEKKGFSRGRVVKLLEPSPQRQVPFCPFFALCGGCNWQHISYSGQLEIKRSIAEEIYQRAGLARLPEIRLIHGPDQGYRSRVQFHRDGEGSWGFNKRGSRDVIPIDQCPLLAKGLNRFLETPPLIDNETKKLHLFGDQDHYWFNRESPVQIEIKGKTMSFHSGLFFQSNLPLLEDLIDTVTKNQKGEIFLDLYGGIGLFSLFLEDSFSRGILVESNLQVEPWVKRNCSEKVQFVGKALERWNSGSLGAVDFVVVDPPRVGMDKKAVQWLAGLNAERICYVSCDPVTQARDLKTLLQEGYQIASVTLLDLYPHTAHMETVVHLHR